MGSRFRPGFRLIFAATLVVGLLSSAWAARPKPSLPAEIPAKDRVALERVAEDSSVSTRVNAEPFVARPAVFEYLLDHPEFATHVTRALRFARYRIWQTPEGLFLDDGWGATGHFTVVYAGNGTRVMYASGQYQQRVLPDIHGQAVVVIEYGFRPASEGRAVVTTSVTGFVKLESSFWSLASKLASTAASDKAEREALRLMKVFARTSRAIEDDPRGVYHRVLERPNVPRDDLEGFRRLLSIQP